MDELQYEQYRSVIESGQLSLDALERIIICDKASGREETPGGLARIEVVRDCDRGEISVKKLYDERGDYLYGNSSPSPLLFKRKVNF